MRIKYFIPLRQVRKIVQYYGGFRKYEFQEHHESSYIYLHEKANHNLWLTIKGLNENNDIQVTLTNTTGLIVQRDYWDMINGEPVKRDTSLNLDLVK
jgi:hypothetical protein